MTFVSIRSKNLASGLERRMTYRRQYKSLCVVKLTCYRICVNSTYIYPFGWKSIMQVLNLVTYGV
jgi:hypothetical protein